MQWGDFDQDGDLDLALAANDPAGSHYLYRTELDVAGRSIQVLVLDGTAYVHGGLSEHFVTEPIDAYNRRATEASIWLTPPSRVRSSSNS